MVKLCFLSGKNFSVIYNLFTADNKDSIADKHNTQRVNAYEGIVLEEVLEEAPKWKVLRVSQSVFVYQFSFRKPAPLITRTYITQELPVPRQGLQFLLNLSDLHYRRTVISNLVDINLRVFLNLVHVVWGCLVPCIRP